MDCSGALHCSNPAAHQPACSFGTQPRHVTVCQNCLAGDPTTRSIRGRRRNAVGGGTATLGRQHLGDARADQPEEVGCLRLPCGDCAAQLSVLERAALPCDALLTHCGTLVSQENGPQLRLAVHPPQAVHRRPPGAGPSSTTRRCRGERRQRSAAASSLARAGFCVAARIAPIRRGGLNLRRVARAEGGSPGGC